MEQGRQPAPGEGRVSLPSLEPQPAGPAPLLPGQVLTPARVLALQRTAGNRATQRALGRAATHGRPAAPEAEAATTKAVGKIGVVKYDRQPELRLRAKPSTSAKVLGELPFGKRLQVISRHGTWLHVSTELGNTGYVAADYIDMDLPEPGARIFKVPPGLSAIGIAERFYKSHANDWGQDLRFYVAVLAKVNHVDIPDKRDGWKSVRFQAGRMIWIPTAEFALGLKDRVQSGSLTHDVAEEIGIADELDRIEELMRDFKTAVELSKRDLPVAIRRHVEASLHDILEALVAMLVTAIGILAVTTAVGAAVSGGTGAGIGFEVGMKFLEWLGLGFLLAWLGDAMKTVGTAFGHFVSTVWHARGNREQLEKGASQFAEAVGLLVAKLFEGIAAFAATRGAGTALGALKNSRFGKALGGRLSEWVRGKAQREGSGPRPVATPPGGLREPAQRHYAARVRQKTVAKNKNTVIEPGVDVRGDVAAINAGRARKVRDEYHVNGRVYGQHDGTLFPIRGAGFHELDRGAFKALGIYNQFGDTFRASEILDKMGIDQGARDAALAVWRAING